MRFGSFGVSVLHLAGGFGCELDAVAVHIVAYDAEGHQCGLEAEIVELEHERAGGAAADGEAGGSGRHLKAVLRPEGVGFVAVESARHLVDLLHKHEIRG